MNMSYSDQFKGSYAGDAYERMFLNSVCAHPALFVFMTDSHVQV